MGQNNAFYMCHGSTPPRTSMYTCVLSKVARKISSSAFGMENYISPTQKVEMLGRHSAFCMSLKQKLQTPTLCESSILAPEWRHHWHCLAVRSPFTRVSLKMSHLKFWYNTSSVSELKQKKREAMTREAFKRELEHCPSECALVWSVIA